MNQQNVQKSIHCSGCAVVKKVDSVISTMEVEKKIKNDMKVETSIWFILLMVCKYCLLNLKRPRNGV